MLAFERDANVLLVGPTNAGKSTLLRQILAEAYFEPPVKHAFVLVPEETAKNWEGFETQRFPVSIVGGLSNVEGMLQRAAQVPEDSLIIFDDLMGLLDRTESRLAIEKWFSVTTHHRHLRTFFVTHDMFHKNMNTIRRNTQNFILFNIMGSDYRAAQDFTSRLLGSASGSALLSLLDYVTRQENGWLRFDQKIQRGAELKTVVSTGGVTINTAWIAARSFTLDGPLFLDAMANPLTTSPSSSAEYQLPDELVDRGERQHESPPTNEGTARSRPADGPSDLQ